METNSNEKKRAIEAAMVHIDRQFGKGSIMRLGDHRAKVRDELERRGWSVKG